MCILGLKPDTDIQEMVTSRRLTGAMFNQEGVATSLVALGRKSLTSRQMNSNVNSSDATGCNCPAQFSGESTRPNRTVTRSQSRMSCTVAAAIMNFPRSESILPTCKGFGVWGLGFGGWDLGFRVCGLWFMVYGL